MLSCLQSAAIADALLLFKRNVTLHFEGVESCAICYSTVSTVDRSLPSKSCKTCDNKFHAGCLYKVRQDCRGPLVVVTRQLTDSLSLYPVVHDESLFDVPSLQADHVDTRFRRLLCQNT